MQATVALGHPTLGAGRSYQGMNGHHEATTGAMAISPGSATQTTESDVSIGDFSNWRVQHSFA
jgi:hypothetical protein